MYTKLLYSQNYSINVLTPLFALIIITIDYCSADEFQCENSELCIPRSYVCDGVSQCGDGSDEDNCG